jgi:hypothetical protein
MRFDPAIGQTTRWRKGQPSPNPGGRPKSRLLSQALGKKLAEVKPDDPEHRTYAEVVAANMVEIACAQGRSAVTAAAEIADRLEGRARVSVEFADVSAELRDKSTDELSFYLENGRWPDESTSEGISVSNAG